jgi:phosphonopyruvate decarboxylase
MNAQDFCNQLKDNGFDFYSGVPCSILNGIIKYLSTHSDFGYVSATREDEAIGAAVGAFMAGKTPVVLMQNSGLGNSVNALTSLALLYKCPMLLVISWRGFEGKDEPEHLLMGEYMLDLLETLKIPAQIVTAEKAAEQIADSAKQIKENKLTVALILKAGVLA